MQAFPSLLVYQYRSLSAELKSTEQVKEVPAPQDLKKKITISKEEKFVVAYLERRKREQLLSSEDDAPPRSIFNSYATSLAILRANASLPSGFEESAEFTELIKSVGEKKCTLITAKLNAIMRSICMKKHGERIADAVTRKSKLKEKFRNSRMELLFWEKIGEGNGIEGSTVEEEEDIEEIFNSWKERVSGLILYRAINLIERKREELKVIKEKAAHTLKTYKYQEEVCAKKILDIGSRMTSINDAKELKYLAGVIYVFSSIEKAVSERLIKAQFLYTKNELM